MSRILIFLAISTALFNLVLCDGFFTIVGSKIIRPDTKYHLSVTSQGYKEPKTLRVSINGTEDAGRVFVKSEEITLVNDQTQTIIFDLKNIQPGDYKLDAKSLSGDSFEKSVDLDLNTKKFSTFVQTDKSIYKPSDKVQFRVLVLDANTKPFQTSNIKVHITDGGNNRVKQYENVKLTKGVFQNELQLSDSPVMGDWQIVVKVDDNEETKKSFEVAEYVLPKFEVIVDSESHVTFKDGKIRATVRGKYTYGKAVKGQATVSAYPVLWLGGVQPFIHDNIVRKVVQVDGKGSVEFDLKEELKIDGEYERYVKIEAIFEEELTGRRQNGSTQVTIHKFKYNMDLIKDSDKFKPGLPFNVYVKVKYHDGAPLVDKTNPIKLLTSYTYNNDNETSVDYYLDNNGMANVKIDVPVNTTHMTIRAKYLESEFHLGFISQAKSHSEQYMQTKVMTENPTINQEVTVDVLTTEEMSQLTYQVMGRGDVIVSKTVPVQNSKSFTFKFLASFAMVPTAHLVVYYIRPDGEIISDQVKIEFGDELQNFIKLELSADQAKPGDLLNITVTTKPDSYVGLLGVDQSVLLLKKGNDIEKSLVFEELEKYNTKTRWNRRWYGGSGSSFSDFDSSGAVVLTNAKEEFPRSSKSPSSNEIPNINNDTQAIRTDIGPPKLFKHNTKPPLAGPYAFSRFPKSAWDHPRIYLKHAIENTWFFLNSNSSGYEGRTTLSKKVPDTITSWIITGFSIDPITGLGLTRQPKKFNVFQPFFVSTNLPYSIKRGEVVAIPIVVFNYMDTDQRAEVILYNNENEFEFTEVTDDINEVRRKKRSTETERKKSILVKSNSGTSVSFMIKPLKVGHITIKIVATSAVAGDGVEKQLIVVPEGVTQYMNKAVFIDLRSMTEYKNNVTIKIPSNAIPDSTKIEAAAIGDILGPSIDNLDKLIKLPSGCGEQNMLNFVPNIVVLEYLTTLNKMTPEIEVKCKKFMETGYQRELTYKHNDGSYSAFGKSDKSGSTWLTAFVAKSFNQASKFVLIDEEIIKQALDFLSSVQAQNGSFPEVGHVSHKDMQGGSSNGIALTAYTLITFLENRNQLPSYQNVVNKALDYIVKNFESLTDSYSLAIASYALQLAKHSAKDSFTSKLDNKAENKNGMKHWEKNIPESDANNPWNSEPNAVNVEMTAYALQAFVEAGLETDAVPIMKWLISQRNENGGFSSTQDTVVGLQALSKLAMKIYVPNSKVDILIKYNGNIETQMNVNAENALILQKYELPSNSRDFEISASGRGFTILQLSYKYNMNVTGAWPRFVLDPQVNQGLSNKDFLHLTVCTSFVPDAQNEKSNMAVMEVAFPSGFTFDSDTLPFLKSTERVKKVETKDGDTIVVVYFDDLDKKELCPVFKAFRTHKVAKQRPAPVIIYDYYDNSRRATQFYKAKTAHLCDICDGDDCGETCKVQSAKRVSERSEKTDAVNADAKGQSNKLSSPLILIALIAISKVFKIFN